jgi:Na+-translocating ferredoxin:NAD+ oxidoreductase RnfC subunit
MAGIRIEDIAAAGVVGAGGAGFPTHIKLAGRADTVLINAAECEPLLHKDKEVLRRRADEVIAGLAAGMALVGAPRGIVGIKDKYQDVISAVRGKLASNMEIAPLPDAYPAGDEFILVYEVLGRVIPPGGIPLHVGAVVMNVETAVNVARAAAEPVTQKYLSVAGAVKNPVTVRADIGVPLSACVAAAGGATVEDAVYLVGGVMMGRLEPDHDAPVTKTTGAVIVLPGDHPVIARYRRTVPQTVRIGVSACDQCCFCTELCPRYLLGHPLEPHRTMRSLGWDLTRSANVAGSAYCCECNLCSMYACPESLDPKTACATNKRALLSAGTRWENPPFNPSRAAYHLANRRAPTSRLMQKLQLTGFRNVGPLLETTVTAARVAIPLRQHIGAPCEPVVTVGQAVKHGDLLGRQPIRDGKPVVGATVHSSIDGKVISVADGVVVIQT